MKNFRIYLTIILIVLSARLQFSQKRNPFPYTCENITNRFNNPIPPPQFGGYMKPERTDYPGVPSDAYFPVLIVFVQFLNDPGPDVDYWHKGEAPDYLDSLVANIKKYPARGNWWDVYSESKEPISDFWMEQSRGHLHIVGRAYSVVLDHEYTYYINNGGENRINDDIYKKLNTMGIKWSDYDKWTLSHIGSNTFFEYRPDGFVDMIYKIHRSHAQLVGMPEGGICFLYPSYSQGDNYLIDTVHNIYINGEPCEMGSGITLTPGYCGTEGQADFTPYAPLKKLDIVSFSSHEHGHYLFGLSHVNYGKMSGVGAPYGFDECLSPWESIRMGYMSPVDVHFTDSLYRIGDFSSRNDDTTGQVLQVSINGTNEFYLIASRRKVSTYDRIMAGDTAHSDQNRDINPEYGKGVYIYHIYGGYYFPAQVDQECADGLYTWVQDGYRVPDWSTTQQVEYYVRTTVSYDNDKSDGIMDVADGKSIFTWFSPGKKNEVLNGDGTDKEYTNSCDVWTSREFLGDRWDAWNVDYNEIFSPYSSPSTRDWSDNNSGIFIWYKNFNRNTNTSDFKIYKSGQGGLNEQQILQMTPPSKPMGLKVRFTDCDNGIKFPGLTWNHNMEPDMINSKGKKQYNIYRADSYMPADLPVDYTLIKSIFIDTNLVPEFVDSLNPGSCNGTNIHGGAVVSRYMITAVDNTLWESVKSDFSSITLSYNLVGVNSNGKNLPNSFALFQNYPNPFNPSTIIGYNVPKTGSVKLIVYDLTGKEILTLVNGEMKAGSYNVVFNGSNLASGIYFYRFIAVDFVEAKKMVLIK